LSSLAIGTADLSFCLGLGAWGAGTVGAAGLAVTDAGLAMDHTLEILPAEGAGATVGGGGAERLTGGIEERSALAALNKGEGEDLAASAASVIASAAAEGPGDASRAGSATSAGGAAGGASFSLRTISTAFLVLGSTMSKGLRSRLAGIPAAGCLGYALY
jgi:hypothetical protein